MEAADTVPCQELLGMFHDLLHPSFSYTPKFMTPKALQGILDGRFRPYDVVGTQFDASEAERDSTKAEPGKSLVPDIEDLSKEEKFAPNDASVMFSRLQFHMFWSTIQSCRPMHITGIKGKRQRLRHLKKAAAAGAAEEEVKEEGANPMEPGVVHSNQLENRSCSTRN